MRKPKSTTGSLRSFGTVPILSAVCPAPPGDGDGGDDDQRQSFECHLAVLRVAGTKGLERRRPLVAAFEDSRQAIHAHPGECCPVVGVVIEEEGDLRLVGDVAKPGEATGYLRLFIDRNDEEIAAAGVTNGHDVRRTVRRHGGETGNAERFDQVALPIRKCWFGHDEIVRVCPGHRTDTQQASRQRGGSL